MNMQQQTKKMTERMAMAQRQKGGTVFGVIIGLIIGLATALAVALYITKTPSNFTNKVQSRGAGHDEAEKTKNKNWDPNAPLANKPALRADAPAAETPAPVPAVLDDKSKTGSVVAPLPLPPAAASPAKAEVEVAKPSKDGKGQTASIPPPAAVDRIGELIKSKQQSADTALADGWIYFLQIGAFRNGQDAQAQRAKVSLQGLDAKVSEREQSGKVIHRVRTGPYEKKDEAEKIKQKLESAGFDVGLVRVARS
jgi:cell division protein FtsN